MKKSLFLFTIYFGLFLLTGCSNSEKSYPTKVKSEFWKIANYCGKVQNSCDELSRASLEEYKYKQIQLEANVEVFGQGITESIGVLESLNPPNKYAHEHEEIIKHARELEEVFLKAKSDLFILKRNIELPYISLRNDVQFILSNEGISFYD